MNHFDIVFDVAAALSCGATLNASVASIGGKWGVVSCRQALGAFDAKSDAWVLSNGRDVRLWDSREEAAQKARALSGSSCDDTGYEAIEYPVLPKLAVTVGALPCAVGPVRFGCVDWSSGPGVELETGDDSAFGAAVVFVALVGNERATEALENVS